MHLIGKDGTFWGITMVAEGSLPPHLVSLSWTMHVLVKLTRLRECRIKCQLASCQWPFAGCILRSKGVGLGHDMTMIVVQRERERNITSLLAT